MSKDSIQETITLTQSGALELQEELRSLKEEKIPQIVERISTAREQGDLSENADYQSAKSEQEILQARIDQIEEILAEATISEGNGGKGSVVGMGSTVVLQVIATKKKVTYKLGGQYESSPAEGKISTESPVGKALSGKQKGDLVKVVIPAGAIEYKILEVN